MCEYMFMFMQIPAFCKCVTQIISIYLPWHGVYGLKNNHFGQKLPENKT